MTATTESTQAIPCFLHQWQDINRGEHDDELDFEERSAHPWSSRPKLLIVPVGWRVAEANGGGLHLYTEDGRHVQFVRMAQHLKSAEFAWAGHGAWFAVQDAE